RLENSHVESAKAQLRSARKRRGSRSDTGDLLLLFCGPSRWKHGAIAKEMFHGVALQPTDLNGLLVVSVIHAGALGQDIHRTNARAARAENIRLQDRQRGAAKIPLRDFLDEAGNVDVCGTRRTARRIEAVQAAVRFKKRFLRFEARMNFRKQLPELR